MNEHNTTQTEAAHKANCKEVMGHICESLGEELNSPKCTAIKQHLEECETCKKYFKSVSTTIEMYKTYNVDMPDDCHKRLFEKLGLEDCDPTESDE